jgi:hypothetical protein
MTMNEKTTPASPAPDKQPAAAPEPEIRLAVKVLKAPAGGIKYKSVRAFPGAMLRLTQAEVSALRQQFPGCLEPQGIA